MKKVYLSFLVLSCAYVSKAQLFQQDFATPLTSFANTSATDAAYVNTTAPTISQFTQLQSSSNSCSIEVLGSGTNANTLHITRSSGTGVFARNGAAGGLGNPTALIVKFDLNVINFSSTSNTGITFQVGDGFSNTVVATEATSLVHSFFAIRLDQTSTKAYKLRNAAGTNSSASHTGTTAITFVINNSGSTFSYTGPDGSTNSLANDTYDLWGGNTKEFAAQAATTASVALNNFKMALVQGEATFDNIVITDPLAVTPVTFDGIKASMRNDKVFVEWNTKNEVNMNRYEIEKSIDGVHFALAGVVASNTSATANAYNWMDDAPFASNNFYRIKSVGKEGSVKYSPVVRISLNKNKGSVLVAPNPVTGSQLNLQLNKVEQGTYSLRISNTSGQTVFAKAVQHNGGSASYSVILPQHLKKGTYYMVLTGQEQSMSKQIFIE